MNIEELKESAIGVQQNRPLSYDQFARLANPTTILALLECVEALRYVQNATHPALDIGKVARAALQKLEAL